MEEYGRVHVSEVACMKLRQSSCTKLQLHVAFIEKLVSVRISAGESEMEVSFA